MNVFSTTNDTWKTPNFDFKTLIRKSRTSVTVKEFKNNRNKMLLSCDLYFLKEDEICEFYLKIFKSYSGIFSQKSTLKVVLIFDQISKKIILFLELQC